MGREVLAVVTCPVCGGARAEVRRMEPRKPRTTDATKAAGRQGGKVGALYLSCRADDGAARCGVIQGSGPEFQRRLAALIGPQPEAPAPAARPAPDTPAPPERAPVPRPAPRPTAPAAETATRRGFFGWGARS